MRPKTWAKRRSSSHRSWSRRSVDNDTRLFRLMAAVTSYQLPAIMVNVGQTSLHKKPAAQAIGLVNKEQVRAGQL